MAHNLSIHGSTVRFADNQRTGTAWHQLCGRVLRGETALQAWEEVVGIGMTYHKRPLGVRGKHGYCAFPGYYGLFSLVEGHHDGGEIVNGHTLYPLGTVQGGYVPLFAPETASIIDRATNSAPIDTMGLLGKSGHTLFCSIALPCFDVAGDECQGYLNIGAPMNGTDAAWAKTGVVRMVCSNTMALAIAEHTAHSFSTRHYGDVADRLEKWLHAIWLQQGEALQTIKDACTVLARASCSQATLKDGVLSTVYPYPDRPDESKLIEPWEKACLKVAEHRQAISHLFEASPTRTAATTGTLWGAYQSVVEYEDYYRPRATAMSKTLGVGAERKASAFSACMALV